MGNRDDLFCLNCSKSQGLLIILPAQTIRFEGQISENSHTCALFDPSIMDNFVTPESAAISASVFFVKFARTFFISAGFHLAAKCRVSRASPRRGARRVSHEKLTGEFVRICAANGLHI